MFRFLPNIENADYTDLIRANPVENSMHPVQNHSQGRVALLDGPSQKWVKTQVLQSISKGR